jgi:hypothetical protein
MRDISISIGLVGAAGAIAAVLPVPAEAGAVSGGLRGVAVAAKPAVAAPALARSFKAATHTGVRAMPNFNTVTAARVPVVRTVGGGRPINQGFVQGAGAMQTHRAGTVVLRHGGPNGRYVSTDLNARRTHLALPPVAPGATQAPAHYYRLTQDVVAPTGQVAAAYGQLGGATQVVLNHSVANSAMVRTIAPNFQVATQGFVR